MILKSSDKGKVHIAKITDNIINVIRSLGTLDDCEMDDIMNKCTILMEKERLLDLSNKNGNLICFNNGCFDLTKSIFTPLDCNGRNISKKPCTFHNMIAYSPINDKSDHLFNLMFSSLKEKETFLLDGALKLRQSPLSHSNCIIGEMFIDYIKGSESILLPKDSRLWLTDNGILECKGVCLSKQINRLVLYERFMVLQQLKDFFRCDDIIHFIYSIYLQINPIN